MVNQKDKGPADLTEGPSIRLVEATSAISVLTAEDVIVVCD